MTWLIGKLLGGRYRLDYAHRTGKYIWSLEDAMHDGGLKFMSQVAMVRTYEVLNDRH